MQRSIFKRYLGVTMLIVMLSFLVLGTAVTAFLSRFWREEKKQQLTEGTRFVAQETAAALDRGEELSAVKELMEGLSVSTGADYYITDSSGAVLAGCTTGKSRFPFYSGSEAEELVPIFFTAPPSGRVGNEELEAALSGGFAGRSDFGGLYLTRYYAVGVPFSIGESGATGTVFAAASPAAINGMRSQLLRVLLPSSAAALLLTFVLAGFFAYRQVQPLRQMSAAARSFGAGDFSVRVPVTSSDELGELAVSFNNMANSLAISEGTRRSFIANVSHELKTPMTTIAGFIDGILDGTIPAEEQEKYLGIVSGEVKRLSRLVRSMLDLSRIENAELKLNKTRFDITNTIVTILLTFEQSISEKRIEVRGLEDAQPQNVFGDQDLLYQVIYNLIENAVKFTNPGGVISVKISDSIDRTTVVIENSGQGIGPDELPHIFERFYKTDKSRSLDRKGMGLGLYIVKTVLTMHGGNITAASEPGKYCRFEFYIPKPPQMRESGRSREVRAQREHKKKDGKEKKNKQSTEKEAGSVKKGPGETGSKGNKSRS